MHRGLSQPHRINFIKWYVYLSNKKWVLWAIKQTNSVD
jgi:hypothetical protein